MLAGGFEEMGEVGGVLASRGSRGKHLTPFPGQAPILAPHSRCIRNPGSNQGHSGLCFKAL